MANRLILRVIVSFILVFWTSVFIVAAAGDTADKKATSSEQTKGKTAKSSGEEKDKPSKDTESQAEKAKRLQDAQKTARKIRKIR